MGRDSAGLGGRISLLGGDAVGSAWPQGQDVILVSYLLGADEIDTVLTAAAGVSFSAADLAARLRDHGFAAPTCEVLIPESPRCS